MVERRAALLEVGAKAIYEFRAHPRRKPWAEIDPETRRAYRTRMQEILNALATAGLEVKKAGKRS